MNEAEIRKNYFQNIFVLTDPNRKKRPYSPPTINDAEPKCIFDPKNIQADEVVVYKFPENSGDDWQILSLLNRYSALSKDNPNSKGSAEVLIETPKHGEQINELSLSEIVDILLAYQDRQQELLKDNKYVHIFKNRGKMAGASRIHTHTQIYALPFVPQAITTETHDFNKYKEKHQLCPFCDTIKKEAKEKSRTIWEDDHVYSFAPFASQFEYEAWIVPKRHFASLLEADKADLESIAKSLKLILSKLEELKLDYNFFLHSGPTNHDFHFHIHVAPRPNNAIWAGLELGSNTYINAIMPEYAAAVYRGEEAVEES